MTAKVFLSRLPESLVSIRHQPTRLLLLGSAALVAGITPPSAPAQVVLGRLVEAGGEGAVANAMMSLADRSGTPVAQTLTRPNGRFQLVASAPGTYRLRADRIGYATTVSDYFSLADGDTLVLNMAASIEAVELAGITVEGDRNCRLRPEDGLAVSKVWEEARKALAAAAWTQDRGLYRYEMLRVRMELDAAGRRVLSEKREYEDSYRESPFVSAPAEELMTKGFAILTPKESIYRAPDARVLLSSAFLDTHCLRLEGRNEAGWLALGFEPGPGRRIPDIAGTFWLDPETARLQRLDFRYRNLNLPGSFASAQPGGWVEFREMPNGTWIVESWRLRMPRPGTRSDRTGRRVPVLSGVTVEGGDVLRVHGAEGEVVAGGSEGGGRIAGIVFDSLRRGSEGALVFVEGANYAVRTDGNGRFEIKHLVPGIYSVNFSLPYFERVAYRPEPLDLEVGTDPATPAQANFSAPSMEAAASVVCRDAGRPGTRGQARGRLQRRDGVLAGQVTDSAGHAVPGASVVVLAADWDLRASSTAGTRVSEERAVATVSANAAGRYVACRLPLDATLAVGAWPAGTVPDDEAVPEILVRELAERRRAGRGGPHRLVAPSAGKVRFADLRIRGKERPR